VRSAESLILSTGIFPALRLAAMPQTGEATLIGHLNKAAGGQSAYRGLGSIDFRAAARSVLLIGRVKREPNVRVTIHDKFVIDEDIEKALKADSEVWSNFQKFPPLYQRVRIDTIQIKKKQPELFQSRLQKLIENTKKGVMYGEWNDNGRLME